MKALKTDVRNRMSPFMLDVLMRIAMYQDTSETFDVNKATAQYLVNHERCDDGPKPTGTEASEGTTFPLLDPVDECQSIEDEAQLELNLAGIDEPSLKDHKLYSRPGILGMLDHRQYENLDDNLDDNQPQLIGHLEQKARSECFAIISKISGLSLTCFGDEIGLSTFANTQNQLWYLHQNDFIVSNGHGKVIQREVFPELPVRLSPIDFHNDRQKWTLIGHALDLEYEIASKNEDNVQLNAFDTIFQDGSRVGASRKADVGTQKWTLEKMTTFFPLPSSTATATPPSTSPQLLTRGPNTFLLKITNERSTKALSIDESDVVVVEEFDDDYDDQKGFRHGSSTVSFQTGMVLQVSEANQPVILALYNSMEIKQEWTFVALAENKKAIVSSYNNLRLDQLEDSYQKVRVIIGVKEKHEEDTQEWTVDVL